MVEQHCRPLRPAYTAGQKDKYYKDYFINSNSTFCDRLAVTWIKYLNEKRPLYAEEWSLRVQSKDIPDLLTRIVIQRPWNVTTKQLKHAFHRANPARKDARHFEKLFEVLELQDWKPKARVSKHQSREGRELSSTVKPEQAAYKWLEAVYPAPLSLQAGGPMPYLLLDAWNYAQEPMPTLNPLSYSTI